jgi:hypothetical protein
MGMLPFTEEQGQELVDNGHMTPETHAEALAAGAYPPAQPQEEQLPWQHADQPNLGVTQVPQSSQPFDMDSMIGAAGPDIHAPNSAQGPVVASNDPNADRAIASSLIQQQSTPPPVAQPGSPQEAGHVDPSSIVQPAQSGAPAQSTELEKLADPNNVAKGMTAEAKGLSDSYTQGQEQAEATAGYLHGMRTHMEAMQAQQQQMEDARQAEANTQYQKVQQAADEASKAAKIDPNNFWNTRSTGQKIAAAIGIALGGIGGGMSGHGGNTAMDVINKAIDRDIDAQKFNADQKGRNFSNQVGLYNVMRQKFGDERQAEAATRMSYLQSAEMQIRETAAKFQSPELQARAMQAVGQLQQKQAEIAHGVLAQGYQTAAMRQLMGGNTMNSGVLSALPKDVQARLVPMDGGATHGIAFDPEAAKEVRAVSSAADNVKSIINEMRQLKGEGARLLPYGTLAARASALRSRMVPALNEMAGIKKISEKEIDLLSQQIPDPGSLLGDKSEALLNGLEQSVHDRTQSYYKNNLMGYKPTHFVAKR